MIEPMHYSIEPAPHEPVHMLDIIGAFFLGVVIGAAFGIAVMQ